MIRTLAILLLLSVPSVTAGQSIDGPSSVPVGRLVRLTTSDVVAGRWLVLPPTPNFEAIDSGRAFFSGETPGAYHFAIVDPQVKVTCWKTVLVTGDGPEPKPDPKPDPIPPPPGEISVVVIVESSDRTPAQVVVIEGLRKYLSQQKLPFRVADPDLKDAKTDAAPTWLRPYLAAIRDVPLPALAVGSTAVDGSFSVVGVTDLPTTAAAAIAAVKSHGG